MEIISANYIAVIKRKKNEKDGEYIDILMGKKGEEKEKTHFGLRVVELSKGKFEYQRFFLEKRKSAKAFLMEGKNSRTGEIYFQNEEKFGEGSTGAILNLDGCWIPKEKRFSLKKITLFCGEVAG